MADIQHTSKRRAGVRVDAADAAMVKRILDDLTRKPVGWLGMNLADRMVVIYAEGRHGRLMGDRGGANPYPVDTAEHHCWAHGWRDESYKIDADVKSLARMFGLPADINADDLLRHMSGGLPAWRRGKKIARSRALTLGEIEKLFAAMKSCEALGRDNELALRLLLLLGVRKGELVGAAWAEFDLDAALWRLPAARSKTSEGIIIPLPQPAVSWLRELETRAAGRHWVFPARRIGARRRGHVSSDTLNAALARVEHGLPPFTVRDLRRTVRTQLSALGVLPHIVERVLNHKLRGVAGVHDRHDYLEERRQALEQWATILENIEAGGRVVPLFAGRGA